MDGYTQRLVQMLGPQNLDALEISGDGWRDFGFRSYRQVQYPSFDICTQPLQQRFDLIIAEQVFEHLLWPYRAGRNVLTTLKPGGHFLITTPFLVKVHDWPVDCTRWTELGLKHFLAECGFELESIRSGSWGNRESVWAHFLAEQPVTFRAGKHTLINERAFPHHVWALARKPAE
jgi:SAM-dependent methyltransferase